MKRVALTLVVIAVISAIAYYVLSSRGLQRADQLERDVQKLREQNDALARDNDALRKRVVALRDDPRLAERKARESSGLARPNEVVFQFDHPDDSVGVNVVLQVGVDRVDLAGKTLDLDGLADALAAVDGDVPDAQLTVRFDPSVDALRQQRVRDTVAQSAMAPAEYETD